MPDQRAEAASTGWVKDARGCRVLVGNTTSDTTVQWSGQCQAGYAEGPGSLTLFSAGVKRFVTEGHLRAGQVEGFGRYQSVTGARYDGEFRGGLRNGQGTFIWPDGSRYIGEWLNGKRSGRGVFHWTNGARYEGEWRNDQKSGQGKMVGPNGEQFEGVFRDNMPNGFGTLKTSTFTRSGIFSNGCLPAARSFDGKATYFYTTRENCGFPG
jgi:hypothetical protein